MKDLDSPVQTEVVKETGYKKQQERKIAADMQGWLHSLRNMLDHKTSPPGSREWELN